jgi:hypothetical protein
MKTAVATTRTWWAFDRQATEDQQVFAKVARRRLRDESARAAAAYRAGGRAAATDAIVDSLWIDYLRRVWVNVVVNAGAHTFVILGAAENDHILEAAAGSYNARNAAERGAGIANTSRNKVKSSIEEGERKREPVERIARRIIADGEAAAAWRSLTIASTEVHAAACMGSLTAAIASGQRLAKIWYGPRLHSITCDQHKTVRGARRPLNVAFEVANDYEPDAGADSMMYPGDGEAGARASNVINCRCWLDFEVL